MPPDRTVRGHSCAQCFFSGVSQCWWQEEQLPPQPSPFQPPCREIHTTASANRTASTSKVMIPRTVIIKKDLSFERIPTPVYTIRPRRATGKRCRLKLFSKNENLGLHLDQRSGIISTFRFGGLAQLVRAPASHAGGLGFESLILHHTVRTRTRFFTKKGSGTFFVYRRFCGRTTRNGKRAKAGYHYDSGILPFALRNQVRFVRTWSSPYMARLGVVAAYVRTGSLYTSDKV